MMLEDETMIEKQKNVNPGYMRLAQAAELYGISKNTMRAWAESAGAKVKITDRMYLVNIDKIKDYLRAHEVD